MILIENCTGKDIAWPITLITVADGKAAILANITTSALTPILFFNGNPAATLTLTPLASFTASFSAGAAIINTNASDGHGKIFVTLSSGPGVYELKAVNATYEMFAETLQIANATQSYFGTNAVTVGGVATTLSLSAGGGLGTLTINGVSQVLPLTNAAGLVNVGQNGTGGSFTSGGSVTNVGTIYNGTVNYAALVGQNGTGGSFTSGGSVTNVGTVYNGTVNYAALVGQNGSGGSFTSGGSITNVGTVYNGTVNYTQLVGQNGTGGSFTAGTVTSANVTSINGSANAASNLASFPPITTTASMFGVTTVINNATTSSGGASATENALAVWSFLQGSATVSNSMGAFVLTLAPGSPVDVTITTTEARIC